MIAILTAVRFGRVSRSSSVKETHISKRWHDFEHAIREYSADLYRFAYWLCRDRHAAEDVVQEACVRAWSAWATLRDPGVTKSWLMTIVRNESARRRSRIKPDASLDEVDEVHLPAVPSCEAGVETAQILARLPESYREPLLMQVLGGFSCAEIAAALGTTEGAVMTRLTRARQALRRQYAEPLRRAAG